jgi:hypothetical protein
MYNFALQSHSYSIYGVILIILINFIATFSQQELSKLRRFMVIFTPMGSVMLAGVIFTGILMMAAKHLEFSLQNIVMILISIVLIVLEAKRSKALRYIKQDGFLTYKKYAYIILALELFLTIATVGFVHATLGSGV